MGIPAKASFDSIALHGLKPWNQIFGVAGKKVSVVRKPVGKWRAVVKDEFLCPLRFSLINGLLKSALFVPVIEDFLLNLRKAGTRVHANCLAGRVQGIHFLAFWAYALGNL